MFSLATEGPAVGDERALLKTIVASPDDDLPRLVYADWLDEHDDPQRSALIRAQCGDSNPAKSGWAGDDVECLLAAGRAAWLRRLPHSTTLVKFSRGFPETFSLPASDLIGAAEVWDTVPVASIRVYPLDRPLSEVLSVPGLKTIRRLTLDASWPSKVDLEFLATASDLRDLESLDLSFTRLAPSDTELIASGGRLTRLVCLSLQCCNLTPESLSPLLECPALDGMRRIDLSFNQLGDEGARMLAATSVFPELQYLDLQSNAITDDGAAALVRGRRGVPPRVELNGYTGTGASAWTTRARHNRSCVTR